MLQARDATEAANRALQRANVELARIATTDPMTGVANRRHFEQVANAARERAQRYHEPLSLLLFDVDFFKAVNDRHGRQTGDRVLIELTRRLEGALRSVDVLARWGGEEFVIIMSHCGAAQALLLPEKLRALVAEHPFAGVGTVTASFGFAEFHAGESLDQWFKRVDLAIYRAKSDGRNTVRLAA